jgi:hypothetical protein
MNRHKLFFDNVCTSNTSSSGILSEPENIVKIGKYIFTQGTNIIVVINKSTGIVGAINNLFS